MPRTKLTKVGSTKRARENNTELEDILRDFDVESESSLQQIRSAHQKNLEDSDAEIEAFKTELGQNVLKLKIGELKQLKSLSDVKDKSIQEMNRTYKEQVEKADEGYLTADVRSKTSESECDTASNKNISTIASLKKLKSRRRSQSVSNVITSSTPGPRSMMNQMKLKTPMASGHRSRSKFRTPVQKSTCHQRAASADRVESIIPKHNPTTPVSILRHPRSGEIAYSVSGSPIVTSNVVEKTANVNIPVINGILSVRPENMEPSHLNASLIGKIDQNTIAHLHTLKNNLDVLMKAFENRKGT